MGMMQASLGDVDLFDCSFSSVIKDDATFNLDRGVPVQSLVSHMREDYAQILLNPEKRGVFVVTLALLAWRRGVLYPVLRDEAVALLHDGAQFEHLKDVSAEVREKILGKYVVTLNSQQIEPVAARSSFSVSGFLKAFGLSDPARSAD